MKKALSVILSLALLLSLSACSGSPKVRKDADFKEWFNSALSPAYEAFTAAQAGKQAPYPTITMMIASDTYINACFDYMETGKQPQDAEITEENGVYTYKSGNFKQRIEFNKKLSAIKLTMLHDFSGESRTQFSVVFREDGGEYFIQYFWTEFNELHEIRFNKKGGSVLVKTDCTKLDYSIFTNDIPKSFAKES